jgi:hypothetical protein
MENAAAGLEIAGALFDLAELGAPFHIVGAIFSIGAAKKKEEFDQAVMKAIGTL